MPPRSLVSRPIGPLPGFAALGLGALLALSPAGAFAAVDLEDEEEEADSETASDEEAAESETPEEGAESAPKAEAEAGTADLGKKLADKSWDRDELQFLVGARGRLMVVPQFLINAFRVDGATTLVAGGAGVEGGISQGAFEGLLGVWYAGYGTDRVPFKGPNDGPEAWELIKSNLGMLYITADLMFKGKIATDWHWFVGGGLGVGIITGTLQRNEAYWVAPASPFAPGDPYTQLQPCTGPGQAAPGVPNLIECPAPVSNDNRYDVSQGTASPAWSVYPWVTYQMGLRYQPVKHFVGRLDLGVGSSGFWVGLGADYGI